ncbi:MAG: RNA polymerase sigma factor RpoD/SigA [Chloroflexales bacterium]
MPPDPLTSPIAALTDHAVLSADDEAALIATLRAGVVAQVALGGTTPTDPGLLRQDFGELSRAVALGAEARATLVRHNMRLIVSIAKRYLPSAGHAFTLDDLISLGCIGLLRGIDKFDPAKSRKLSTYATWWIRQAISRGIAEEGRVIDLPVHLHDRLRQQRRAQNQLAQQLGREPAPEELAAHLGWSVARVAQLELVGQETRSLNARLHADDEGSELGDILPDQRFDPAATALDASLRHDVAATMARLLNERERRFLRAYFGFDSGEKVTLEEIGAVEGLTRERVRQVIAGAIATLRADPLLRSYAAEDSVTDSP